MIKFLGLDWDPACLDFQKTDRPVRTASKWQVRQPVTSASVGRPDLKRWRTLEDGGPRILAADIAGQGDDSTAVVLLAGRRLHVIDVFQEGDPMVLARRLYQYAEQLNASKFHIDATGIGWGVFGKLKELADEHQPAWELVDVVLGKAAHSRHLFTRLLDEVWFACRTAFDPTNEEAVAVDPDATTLHEQLNVRGWKLDDRARVKVETKKELRKRGAGSPDVGDAASLCFYRPPEAEVTWFST